MTAFRGLNSFITELEKKAELHRIKTFVDPVLEIAEVTDRVTKNNGKALLFENTGTRFPLLINAFGSDNRIAIALGKKNLNEIADEIEDIFNSLTSVSGSVSEKISLIPRLLKLSGFMPVRSAAKGLCQKNIIREPDLDIFPILKCWPHDGGRFITLPIVHTVHPVSGKTNAGMYRMQIIGKDTTGMHWQRHKTGAAHFEAWKKSGNRMPVTVTLGGDPVYTYCATAPLPENVSEYILAGFLRKKRVTLVKCISNDLFIPSDADIVIEGYVDPSEDLIYEGPFGDHTGFYSLADYYPLFHITCITYSDKAVYPATIVGIPPQEDAWLIKATEMIFLSPIKLALQPEILDFHMPEAGVAHNLVIVKITKSFPGQGLKVINSLFGAGQMMLTKYLIVVSGDINIRDYKELLKQVLANTDLKNDIVFTRGPLDVLDHSSDYFSFGGKAGIDATVKLPEEIIDKGADLPAQSKSSLVSFSVKLNVQFIIGFNPDLLNENIKILILKINPSEDHDSILKTADLLRNIERNETFRLFVAVDHTVDIDDYFMVAWQVLGNSDPMRDTYNISPHSVLIDGSIKHYSKEKFPRRWPNIVCSDEKTIKTVDEKWSSLGISEFIPSPSLKYMKLKREGTDMITS